MADADALQTLSLMIRMIEERLRAIAARASGARAAIDAGSDLVAIESLMGY